MSAATRLEAGPPDVGQLAGVVLCGGASSRMGEDKALMNLSGRPMAEWVLSAQRSAGLSKLVLAGLPPGGGKAMLEPLMSQFEEMTVIEDRCPGAGPLAAIINALDHLGDIFVSPCDTPALGAPLVSRIVSVSADTERPAVLAFGDRLEPLVGVYRAAAAEPLRRARSRGAKGPMQAIRSGELLPLAVAADPARLTNVNGPSDVGPVEELCRYATN